MDLLTTSEVADYLRLKERTVYEMAAKRQIPCTRATGKLLFSRKLIERWVEGRTELPTGYGGEPPPIYAGSSDPLLEWALRESGSGLAMLASGSRDGLERLAGGEALVAGIHLYDPESETYNVRSVRLEIPFPDVVAIRWAEREQGLLVARGNPLQIASFAELHDRKLRIVVRPEGAGSRVLFDVLAQEAGHEFETLNVLPAEARTESDLAGMIADGEADCGIGVAAVARRNGLDFIPLGIREQFDLVMRRRDYFEPPVQKLLAFAQSDSFRKRAGALSGYELGRFGEVTFNG